MALDFPNAPILNQTFTAPNGTIWLWDGVKWTATTSTSPFGGQGNVGRNLLHNPLFQVAQRGVGPFATFGLYALDRWMINGVTDTVSVIQQPASDTMRAQIGDEACRYVGSNTFTGVTAGTNFIEQRIESVQRLSNKTITVSFYAATSVSIKLGVNLYQSFGTGGSPSALVWVAATGTPVNVVNTWGHYTTTFSMPSTAAKTLGSNGNDSTNLRIYFSCGSGNSDYAISGNIGAQSGIAQIWGVQLEVGSVATPLEKPDPRYDLANCQRFYCVGSVGLQGYQISSANALAMLTFPTTMRASPTMTVAWSNTGITSPNISAVNASQLQFWGAAAASFVLNGTFTASADL